MRPKIVTLGTGTGQRRIIEGLPRDACERTAVVGVTDNGGSSAVLRRSLSMPQPGDTRNCLTAMSPDSTLRKLFDFRFQSGDLAGVNLGNYILGALTEIEGDFGLAVERAGELLAPDGRVLPVSTTSTQVAAELVDGNRIYGEWEIIRREPRVRILRVFLEEALPIYPPASAAIREADLIVIGPGSLRTGILPVLLTTGLKDAVRASGAPVVYICNLMTQPGQTDGYSARAHVEEVERYLGMSVDHVVLNRTPIPNELREHFRALGSEPVEDDFGEDVRVRRADLLQGDSIETLRKHRRPDNVFFLYHDAAALGQVILAL